MTKLNFLMLFVLSKMTSIERLNEYIDLKKENLLAGARVPANWPANGEILFENVSFAYDDGLPSVLKTVSFKVNAKEKVGVVGRTGAGKSTIFQSLYRIAEPSGRVLVDGVNIKDINLVDLRNKMAIIPVISACIPYFSFRFAFVVVDAVDYLARTSFVHGLIEIQS